jgi:HEAT repeat protein
MLTRSCLKLFSAVLLSFVPVLGTAGVARSRTCLLRGWDGAATQLFEYEITQTIQQTLYDPNIPTEGEQYFYSEYRCSVPNKLAHIGPSVVPHLIPLLKDQDARIRSDVATALGLLGKSAQLAIPPLIALFKEEHSLPEPRVKTRAQRLTEVDPAAGNALRMMGELAIPDLILLLKDENVLLRFGAALVLGNIGKPAESAIPDIVPLLRDKDKQLQSMAFIALGGIGESAIPVLTPLLKDSDESVRQGAMESLKVMGESAIPALVSLLKDDDEWRRFKAVEILGDLPNSMDVMGKVREPKQSVIPALVPLLKDKSPRIRSRVAIGLGRMERSGQSSVLSLIPLLNDENSDVRANTAFALGSMGKAHTITQNLESLVRRKDATVQADVIAALGEMAEFTKTVIPYLTPLLKDQDTTVRTQTILALEYIRELDRAISSNQTLLLKNKNSHLPSAAKAIKELGGKP